MAFTTAWTSWHWIPSDMLRQERIINVCLSPPQNSCLPNSWCSKFYVSNGNGTRGIKGKHKGRSIAEKKWKSNYYNITAVYGPILESKLL
jgi:hypothetical protein